MQVAMGAVMLVRSLCCYNGDGDDDDVDDDDYKLMVLIMMLMQGDSGGPLVSCGEDSNCGTNPGQNYDLIGAASYHHHNHHNHHHNHHQQKCRQECDVLYGVVVKIITTIP